MTTIELTLIAIVVLYYSVLTIMNYHVNNRTLNDITLQMNNLQKTVNKLCDDTQVIQTDMYEKLKSIYKNYLILHMMTTLQSAQNDELK